MTAGVAVVVLGTSAADQYLLDGSAELCAYSNPATHGAIWNVHKVPDDGTPGNIVDGSGNMLKLQLINIVTGLPVQSYRRNTNVFINAANQLMFPFAIDPDGSAYIRNSATGSVYRCDTLGSAPTYFTPATDIGGAGCYVDASGNMWARGAGDNIIRESSINYSTHTSTETATTGSRQSNGNIVFLRNADAIAGRVYFNGPSAGSIRYVDKTSLVCTEIVAAGASGPSIYSTVGNDGFVYTIDTNTTLRKYDPDGALVASLVVVAGASGRDVSVYDSTGILWINGRSGGFDLVKVKASDMTIAGTVSNAGTPPMTNDWFHVIGEPLAGTIAVNYSAEFGGLGVVFGVAGKAKLNVTLAGVSGGMAQARKKSFAYLGKVFGAATPPPTPDDKGPRCLLALRFNEKWFFGAQGKDLSIVAGGFQNGTPAIFGTDGQNVWQLFSAPDRAIKSRIQTAYWPMKKPTHMKEGLKAGVEVTTPSSSNVVSLMLDSDFGSIPATFSTANEIVWVNQFNIIIPWVNFLGDIIPFGKSGFVIYQGDAEFKGRYLGYTMVSSSPGYAINGFLAGYQMSTPWAVKAQT